MGQRNPPRSIKVGDKVVEPLPVKHPVQGVVTAIEENGLIVLQRPDGIYHTSLKFYGMTWRLIEDEAKPSDSPGEGNQVKAT